MAKLTLSDIINFQATSLSAINNNSALIEAAFDNTLSRDGTTPNSMSSDLDMNSNRILNLVDATTAQEPVTYAQFLSGGGGSGGGAPTDATYLTLSTNIPLSNERVLTAGTNITFTDTGPGGTLKIDAATGGGGGAPTTSQYLTLAADATLSNERVLTAGTNIAFVDGGPGGSLTINASAGAAVPGGANTQVQFNATGAFDGDPEFTWSNPALTIGNNGTATGILNLKGTTSGTVSIIPQAAAGVYNFNLPTGSGTANQLLTSGGGGATAQSYQNIASLLTAGANISVTGTTNATIAVTGTVGAATNTTNVAVTDDTTTAATMFPLWVTTASGNQTPKVSSTKLTFNPSTGVLGAANMLVTGAYTGPILVGGSGAASSLELRATTGAGVGSEFIKFTMGNNGGTEAMRIWSNGKIHLGSGVAADLSAIDVRGPNIDTTQTGGLKIANTFTGTINHVSGIFVEPVGGSACNITAEWFGVHIAGPFVSAGGTSADYTALKVGDCSTVGGGGTVPGTKRGLWCDGVNSIAEINGPLTGGRAAGSALTLQSTTGVGTTDNIIFKGGNNGAITYGVFKQNSLSEAALGIGTTTVGANHLVFVEGSSTSPRGIAINRSTVANEGTSLNFTAGAAKAGASNQNGGNINYLAGASTGSGTAGHFFYAYPGTAAAASDNTVTEVINARVLTGVQIRGTATNDNAPAGYVGEFISSTITSGSAVAMTTGVATNITSIVLTPGDWDVWWNGAMSFGAGTNFTLATVSISLVSATTNFTPPFFGALPTVSGGVVWVNGTNIMIAPARFQVTSNTTVFAVGFCNFTVSTAAMYGALCARRAR
jgi:hypothetical protein